MRSGEPLTQLVEFTEGFPDGNISWVLRDGDNNQITTDTVTPAANSVSAVVTVSGTHNTLSGGNLYGYRELSWSYLVGGIQISGLKRYRVEAFLNFGVSPQGVRDKLGLETHELDDDSLDLVLAYSAFRNAVGAAELDAITDSYKKLLIRDAIEALAGLRLLPTLQIKVAQREISGVSQFQRGAIKWDDLKAHLNELLAMGYTAVNATLDPAAGYGSIFAVVVRNPDPISGENVT